MANVKLPEIPKTVKKYLKIFLLLITVLLLLNACDNVIRQIKWWSYGFFEYEAKDFNKNKKHFEIVSDKLYAIFKDGIEEHDDLESILVHPSVDVWDVKYFFEDETKNITKQVPMTAKEKESIHNVYISLSSEYGELGAISVHRGRVTFKKEATYAVIHTRNWKAPEFLMVPGDHDKKDRKYSYRKLAHNWYEGAFISKD